MRFSYPAVYNNVRMDFFFGTEKKMIGPKFKFGKSFEYGKIKEFHIEPGFYSSVDKVLISMNSVLKKVTKNNQNSLKRELNPISYKLQIKLTNRSRGIYFGSSDLRTITGFDSDFYVILNLKMLLIQLIYKEFTQF